VTELLFSTAFTLWGLDSSWLELIAVLLAFAMMVCNIMELHWG
jgi:nicotinamide mononucleotide transporter